MASRSSAGLTGERSRDHDAFDAPATLVDEAPAGLLSPRARPPSTEVALAQLDANYAATRESREVVALLAAHEVELARERQASRPPPLPRPPVADPTLEVSDGDIEAELPVPGEDFEEGVPTLIREPTPAFTLSGRLPSRVIELPLRRPVAEPPPPPPSLLARARRLPLAVRVALVCAWLVLVGAAGVAASRAAWRATAPDVSSQPAASR